MVWWLLACERPPSEVGTLDLVGTADRVWTGSTSTLTSGHWPLEGTPAQQAQAVADSFGAFAFRRHRRGKVGDYFRYRQLHDGLPVFDGELVVHVVDGAVRDVNDARRRVGPTTSVQRMGSADEAIATAAHHLGVAAAGKAELGVREDLAWQVRLTDGSWLVEVGPGGVVGQVRSLRHREDGVGLVFDPNPVSSSGDPTLSDLADTDQTVLNDQRIAVTLPRLDGSGFLRGDWVDARPNNALESNLAFSYTRQDDRFEEVNAYFHVDRTQQRIQSLGFMDAGNLQQVVHVNGTTSDVSWFDELSLEITLGKGGVDDAEDGDIIVHEYGHAVQEDQVPGYGSSQNTAAMSEGFADYQAAAMSATFSPQGFDPACVGEWDATSYSSSSPPCLRRVDGTRHYPEFASGSRHSDGEMWSGMLWSARDIVGPDVMDAIVYEHHYLQSASASFFEAAAVLRIADTNLTGGANLHHLYRASVQYGMTRDLTPSPALPAVVDQIPVDLGNTRDFGLYPDSLDETVSYTVPGAAGLRVRFTDFETETWNGCLAGVCDHVYITNADGDLYAVLGGSLGSFTSQVIAGDTVNIRLVTDNTERRFGWHVDRVEVMAEMGSCPTCETGDTGLDDTDSDPIVETDTDMPGETDTDEILLPDDTDGPDGPAELVKAGGCGCQTTPAHPSLLKRFFRR